MLRGSYSLFGKRQKRKDTHNANLGDVKLMVAQGIKRYKTNLEKDADKVYVVAATGNKVGQINGGLSGHFVTDVTPKPIQDVSDNGRIGSDIKLSRLNFTVHLFPSDASFFEHEMKVRYDIWLIKGSPITDLEAINFYNHSTDAVSVIDMTSTLDPSYSSTKQASRICSQVATLKMPFHSEASSVQSNCHALTSKSIKLNHKVRFDDDSMNVTGGQLKLVVLADSGNRSTTSTSSFNVPVQLLNTGADFNYKMEYYYLDQ